MEELALVKAASGINAERLAPGGTRGRSSNSPGLVRPSTFRTRYKAECLTQELEWVLTHDMLFCIRSNSLFHEFARTSATCLRY